MLLVYLQLIYKKQTYLCSITFFSITGSFDACHTVQSSSLYISVYRQIIINVISKKQKKKTGPVACRESQTCRKRNWSKTKKLAEFRFWQVFRFWPNYANQNKVLNAICQNRNSSKKLVKIDTNVFDDIHFWQMYIFDELQFWRMASHSPKL